jgi:hypothetical protein
MLDTLQTGKRFPQWPGRQQISVSPQSLAIHYDDFHVTFQPVMLQSVIGDNDVDTLLLQKPGGCHSIGMNRNRTPGTFRQQHRFVTHD